MFDSLAADALLSILREGLFLAILVSAPFLLMLLIAGLLAGAFSATTQIHDHSVGFVPRFAIACLGFALLGPYLGAQLVRFTVAVFSALGSWH
jgi:flagellar biosynthesis protein FliQ